MQVAPVTDVMIPCASALGQFTSNAFESMVVPGAWRECRPRVKRMQVMNTGAGASERAGGESDARAFGADASRALFARDRASQALGMRVLEVGAGHARVAMTVRGPMLNGHQACHGGVIFSLADTAFALACNSRNDSTVAAAASVDFLRPAKEGDELTAEARELWLSRRNGLYEVSVSNQRGECIAVFRGRSYRLGD